MRHITRGLLAGSFALAAVCSPAVAATFEKPFFALFKGQPAAEAPVMGYVQFGSLADGSPAIQAVSDTRVRFYERAVLLKGPDYFINEIDCKSGRIQLVGAGSIESAKALAEPIDSGTTKTVNPRNVALLREVCFAGKVKTGW